MNEGKDPKSVLDTFEWHSIDPKTEYYDDIGRRFFINTTEQPLMVGFGHNTRQLELIAIAVRPEKKEDPDVTALEGQEITE